RKRRLSVSHDTSSVGIIVSKSAKEDIFMSALQKILVHVEFSEESANDLKYAVALAQETQAELVVLHVTQKEAVDYFLDPVAVMEGSPMLNRPARIPVDRLLREKALDL